MAADITQLRLLDAAGQVFAEKGYQAATVREICRRADIQNLAAVNYYFGDKEKLYAATVRQAFAGEAAEEMADWPPGTSPASKLRDFLTRFLQGLIGEHRPNWHFHLMARELAQPSAGCLAFVREFARPRFDRLLAILEEIVPPELSMERRHLLAFSILGQCIHHRCGRAIVALMVGEAETQGYTAGRLADHIADFCLAALGLEPPVLRVASASPKSLAEGNAASGDVATMDGPGSHATGSSDERPG